MTESKGMTVIGNFVWWNIRNVKIKKEEVKALLKKYKIDYKIENMPPRCLFSKAVSLVKVKNNYRGLLIRKINKNPDEYLFGLVDETVDKDAEALEYNHSATMSFVPQTGELTVDRPHRAFDLVSAAYQEYFTYFDSEDIRDIILDVIRKTYSIGVRDRGGVYFIPSKFTKEVENLEKFVKAVGPDCYFAAVPQIDLDKTKRSIYKAFNEELQDKVNKYKAELEDDGINRTSALERRLEEYKDLKKELEFYADSFAFQSEGLTKQIDELRSAVQKKLSA